MSSAKRCGESAIPRAFCSAVPAAGTMPDEQAVAPLGAASRSSTSTSAPALRAASAAVAPAPPAPITTTDAVVSKRADASCTIPIAHPLACLRCCSIHRAARNARASSLGRPITCTPSGRSARLARSARGTGTLICGPPNNCQARLNCGSPVLPSPCGASPGALGASTTSAEPNNSSMRAAQSRPVRQRGLIHNRIDRPPFLDQRSEQRRQLGTLIVILARQRASRFEHLHRSLRIAERNELLRPAEPR